MKRILIIGTGGLAREFTSWSSEYFQITGYSSTNHTEHSQFNLPGTFYAGDVTPDSLGTDLAVLAIGSPSVKVRIYDKFSKLGFKFPSFIHPSSIVSDLADISEGVIISPNCVISPNVSLEKLAYVNFCCGIGHDAIVGSFAQINPGVQLGGFSKIGECVLVGSGATVLQGVSVGDGATIGSGSVVFSNVSELATVMGNPAKRMRAFEK
jgi:sugar O-acyltransferase (sialic acid O-acetyltransferase NeuD family)